MSKNEFPLVSVGLPIYNRPEGLRRTLECFINQTYSNIEIIIADNCSPNPEVEKIAREYEARDNRISYFRHNENKGWGYNTNFVIDKAKGEYFLRATDDDWWDVTYIDKIISLIINGENVILGMSNFSEVDIHGELSKCHISNHLPLLQEFTTSNKMINLKNYILQFEGFGKAQLYGGIISLHFLRSDTVKLLLEKEFLAGDLLINLYLLLRGNLVVFPDILYKGTSDNVRYYDTKIPKLRKIDIGVLVIDYGLIKDTFKKWNKYFYYQINIIFKSDLKLKCKFTLYFVVLKRKCLFYFDLICIGFRSRGYNIFSRFKRKNILH